MAKETLLTQNQEIQVPSILRDKGGRIRWSLPGNSEEENLMLGIKNIRAIFLERYPEFNELFPKGEDEKIIEDKRGQAEEFILDRIGKRQEFVALTGESPFSKNTVPYFQGSYHFVLEKSFNPWGLDLSLPKVDKETRWTDANGNNWASSYFFRKNFKINGPTLSKRLIGVPSRAGVGLKGHEIRLYNEAEVSRRINEFFALPQVDSSIGQYQNEDGECWAPANYFKVNHGLSAEKLSKFMQGVRSIAGRDGVGHETILYNVPEVTSQINNFLLLPRVNNETGSYTENSTSSWVSRRVLRSRFQVSGTSLSSLLVDVPQIQGRSRVGAEVVLFDESKASEKISEFLNLPRVDKVTGLYTDENNQTWVPQFYFRKSFGLQTATMRRHLRGRNINVITGRDISGKVVELYNQEDIMDALKGGNYSPKEKIEKDSISPDEANEQLRRFLEE
ncbi:hypothetical protein HYU92_02800 [Candidatus Curtissbacteria bacterium]|nr:hypothetical protein [Candidatus Curtissbacteria bacterium]